mmetsp:Transcript_33155/g.69643  ORF Transcript_33155/g.69643 Transcript_33155/m.69643 type:complete len:112 (-) Transcript_33155:1973-2308(-)
MVQRLDSTERKGGGVYEATKIVGEVEHKLIVKQCPCAKVESTYWFCFAQLFERTQYLRGREGLKPHRPCNNLATCTKCVFLGWVYNQARLFDSNQFFSLNPNLLIIKFVMT